MRKLLVYLDNCCFNRPFDDQNSLKVYLETQAKLMIQSFIKDNIISLIWSFILDYENSANPDDLIKDEIQSWRKTAKRVINQDEEILKQANILVSSGFGKKDALHLACACRAKVDFFITVDKGIINKASILKEIKIITPIDLITYLEEKK